MSLTLQEYLHQQRVTTNELQKDAAKISMFILEGAHRQWGEEVGKQLDNLLTQVIVAQTILAASLAKEQVLMTGIELIDNEPNEGKAETIRRIVVSLLAMGGVRVGKNVTNTMQGM